MQIDPYKKASRSRPQAFGLIELLVVMGIISLLLVAAFPLFSNTTNSARVASREIIKAHLQQARAHAIASGNATALAIPILGADPDLGAHAIGLIEVENSTGTYLPLKDAQGHDVLLQRFGKLSGNFYFLSSVRAPAAPPTILETGIALELISRNRTIQCRAIVFAPSGQIVQPPSGTHIIIAIGQAVNHKGDLSLTDNSAGKPVLDLLQINRLTGRAKFDKAL